MALKHSDFRQQQEMTPATSWTAGATVARSTPEWYRKVIRSNREYHVQSISHRGVSNVAIRGVVHIRDVHEFLLFPWLGGLAGILRADVSRLGGMPGLLTPFLLPAILLHRTMAFDVSAGSNMYFASRGAVSLNTDMRSATRGRSLLQRWRGKQTWFQDRTDIDSTS